jgi:hypothetical protein
MTKLLSNPRFLVIYSGVLTVAFVLVVLTGFAESRRQQRFDEIDVHRINVIEPDGTLRLVMSNKAEFPASSSKEKKRRIPIAAPRACCFSMTKARRTAG